MKLVKDNKGISLVILSITIMVMIIIAGITISIGTKEINTTREQKLISELKMVNTAVFERYFNYAKTKNEDILVGIKVADTEIQKLTSEIGITLVTIPTGYNENEKAYYRLSPTDLEKIGIQKAEDTYIVNYVTGEVINETKKKTASGEILYTYSRKIFNNVDVTAF